MATGMPLEGIRVVDLTRALAGPSCTRRLGDFGADIIKIEEPGTGDMTRVLAGPRIGDTCSYFHCINRNKRSITLNLKLDSARRVVYDLVAVSDVVVENFRPKVCDRLGIGYDALKKVNPRIIYCSISGYGQEGPKAMGPAYDPVIQAFSGNMSVTGTEGGPPCLSGVPIVDMLGGATAVYAILAALLHRERTGEGGRIDTSLADNLIDWLVYLGQFHLVDGRIPGPVGSGHPTNFHRAFTCRDGKWLQISAVAQRDWERLTAVLARNPGYETLPTDTRFDTFQKRVDNRPIMWPYLDALFVTKDRADWLRELEEGDIACGPVNNVAEALSDPQTLARRMVVEVDQPHWGKYKTLGMPVKMTQIPEERFDPPPVLGEHNREILEGLLGYSSQYVDSLVKENAI